MEINCIFCIVILFYSVGIFLHICIFNICANTLYNKIYSSIMWIFKYNVSECDI